MATRTSRSEPAVGEVGGLDMLRQPGRRRPYRQIERRYVVEYVAAKYPKRVAAYFNLRLGLPPEELRRRYPELPPEWGRVWMPFADAVVITESTIDVIEAKIRNPRQALGQLLDYVRRVPYTPELRRYLGREVRPILVMPYRDPEIERTCAEIGIYVDYFRPLWVEEYMKSVGLLPRT